MLLVLPTRRYPKRSTVHFLLAVEYHSALSHAYTAGIYGSSEKGLRWWVEGTSCLFSRRIAGVVLLVFLGALFSCVLYGRLLSAHATQVLYFYPLLEHTYLTLRPLNNENTKHRSRSLTHSL